ncbi:MAG: toll/interleukin-1 receptor domain-containing protein [Xanthomonadales bacterium]|nr:toll/interleukin-1 receptor domain-containing protein [Xanthomonadales bacterium]
MEAPRYKTFISYSHRDEVWARWLQHALEKYRVPKRLVGTPGAFGPIPARLNPVFRDREDLSSASDLTTQIKGELARSESLVVICSPFAAVSPWVAEEIRYFRQLGKSDRILALIVDGDPQASIPAEACFPSAILEAENGSSKEPLAADVRRYADGKRLALLKIVAGILGVRLDELRRRDAQRTTRNRIVYSLATLALVAVIGWLTWSEATTRASAKVQRTNTEELLGYMLGDLKRLDPIVGLEFVLADDAMQQRFREGFKFDQMDNEALLNAGMNWREAGIDAQRQSDLNINMDLFQRSRAAFIELNQRENNSTGALFELGQAEFYVGEVYHAMGEIELAEQAWTRYGAVTRRLVNAEPNNARYVMELSYTLTNLGALELGRLNPDTARLLQLVQAGVQYNQMALVLDPGNAEYRDALPNNLAWQADAWLEKCELGQALDIRQQAVKLRRELLAEDPASRRNKTELAMKLTGLAGVKEQIGLDKEASDIFAQIDDIFSAVHRAEPEDTELEWEMYYRQGRYARHLLAMGEVEKAGTILERIAERYDALSDPLLTGDYQRGFEAARTRLDRALVLLAKGQTARGTELLFAVRTQMEEMVEAKPEARDGLEALARVEFEMWRQLGLDSSVEINPALDVYLSQTGLTENCSAADLGARLALVDGNLSLARSYTDYVLSKGYSEADFVSFCMEFQLCDLP